MRVDRKILMVAEHFFTMVVAILSSTGDLLFLFCLMELVFALGFEKMIGEVEPRRLVGGSGC